MRRFLATLGLGAALVGLAACTGNTGSANLVPKTLGAIPVSNQAYPVSNQAYPVSVGAIPI